MYPFIHLGSLHIPTFGLLLWLGAVCAVIVLQKNFTRYKVDADALTIVALATLAGIVGAKAWHELQNPQELARSWAEIAAPGAHHPVDALLRFLHWFQEGFAWYGGMLAGIAALLWQGHTARFVGPLEGTLGKRVGPVRMLDLAAPAAAVGYGVGRIGCLTSGDGDYGIPTKLPWGVHMAPDALVPTRNLVQPTPVYEFLFAILVAWILWELGKRYKPVGWLTGLYLVLSGVGRFLVEFVRINPKLYWGMSNAQVAALGSVLLGVGIMIFAQMRRIQWQPEMAADPLT
jgi:phosphatidylglycerol---prolipoprotein diacylglyceryl transferase